MVKWVQMAWVTAILGFAVPINAASAQQAHIVASIKPVHSLVAAVMEGAGTPHLIVQGAGSPHTYNLKPSDAKALQQAKLIFWVGRKMEGFLDAPIRTLGKSAGIIEFSEASNLRNMRDPNSDMHLWLDPENAKSFVKEIVKALVKADPENANIYERNGPKLRAKLEALTAYMKAELEPVKDRPYIVFHDAYQYLEKAFGLNAVGAVTISPDRQPGARRVKEIQGRIAKLGAVCIFSEPQFEPRIIKAIAEGSNVRTGILDPLGAELSDGPDLYFNLMKRNTKALKDCLSAQIGN